MYGLYLSSRKVLAGVGVLRFGATKKISLVEPNAGITFILAIVINIEMAKTKASFSTFGAIDIWKYNALFGQSSSKLLSSSFF